MATLAPAGSLFMQVFDSANRELRRRTGNTLSIRWYAGGVQGDEPEVIRKMRSGRLDGGAVTAAGLGQIHRPILAFQIPGIFSDDAHLVRARDALQSDLLAAFQATRGSSTRLRERRRAPTDVHTHAVRVPHDLVTSHPWLWPADLIGPAIYQEAGAQGVSRQLPEVLAALQTNQIDTLIAPPMVATSLQWTSQMHFISDRSNAFSLGAVIISASVFNTLPPEQQQILREVQSQYAALLAHRLSGADDAAIASLQQRGVQVMTLNQGERDQWTQLFQRVRTRLVGNIADQNWISRVETAGR